MKDFSFWKAGGGKSLSLPGSKKGILAIVAIGVVPFGLLALIIYAIVQAVASRKHAAADGVARRVDIVRFAKPLQKELQPEGRRVDRVAAPGQRATAARDMNLLGGMFG